MKYQRVLLADSHLNMLQGVHGLLQTLFETVVMVADEPSLIEAVKTLKPDIVIVDLSLPAEEGANVVLRLIEKHPTLPILVLSVYDEPSHAFGLLETGVCGVVLKRSAATNLVPAVRAVLGGGLYVCPALRASGAKSALNDASL